MLNGKKPSELTWGETILAKAQATKKLNRRLDAARRMYSVELDLIQKRRDELIREALRDRKAVVPEGVNTPEHVQKMFEKYLSRQWG